ncbi:hypothetical protein BU15DRAFT_67462 [Melanogaster broomeanus]|nr:hypothetical protein BU15DRAFT_67462 [Melanogaster broomeanus]
MVLRRHAVKVNIKRVSYRYGDVLGEVRAPKQHCRQARIATYANRQPEEEQIIEVSPRQTKASKQDGPLLLHIINEAPTESGLSGSHGTPKVMWSGTLSPSGEAVHHGPVMDSPHYFAELWPWSSLHGQKLGRQLWSHNPAIRSRPSLGVLLDFRRIPTTMLLGISCQLVGPVARTIARSSMIDDRGTSSRGIPLMAYNTVPKRGDPTKLGTFPCCKIIMLGRDLTFQVQWPGSVRSPECFPIAIGIAWMLITPFRKPRQVPHLDGIMCPVKLFVLYSVQ